MNEPNPVWKIEVKIDVRRFREYDWTGVDQMRATNPFTQCEVYL